MAVVRSFFISSVSKDLLGLISAVQPFNLFGHVLSLLFPKLQKAD
jgi:hypothetical protein